jgi:ketosteroid isomerase-like protein
MGAASPDLTAGMFVERFNAGDAAGMVLLYEDDAVFTYDGEDKAVGRAQIEAALAGFQMARLKMRGSTVSLYVSGDLAMTRMKWELVDASGAIQSSGISCEVQKRGADGLWRFLVDDATGGSRA